MKTLYVMATPIGNLDDMSASLIKSLECCEVVFCESISSAQRLYQSMGVKPPRLVRYWHKNEADVLQKCEHMVESYVGLISDAGTPAISDPGYTLVNMFHKKGWTVKSIPGPCAAISALVMSGMSSESFCFSGFLAVKSAARKRQLALIQKRGVTSVIYESPRRVQGLLKDIATVFGDVHRVFVVREMTKLHEQYCLGSVKECLLLLEDWVIKGEFVVVVQRCDSSEEWRLSADVLRKYLSVHDAADCASELCGESRSNIYRYLLGKK